MWFYFKFTLIFGTKLQLMLENSRFVSTVMESEVRWMDDGPVVGAAVSGHYSLHAANKLYLIIIVEVNNLPTVCWFLVMPWLHIFYCGYTVYCGILISSSSQGECHSPARPPSYTFLLYGIWGGPLRLLGYMTIKYLKISNVAAESSTGSPPASSFK